MLPEGRGAGFKRTGVSLAGACVGFRGDPNRPAAGLDRDGGASKRDGSLRAGAGSKREGGALGGAAAGDRGVRDGEAEALRASGGAARGGSISRGSSKGLSNGFSKGSSKGPSSGSSDGSSDSSSRDCRLATVAAADAPGLRLRRGEGGGALATMGSPNSFTCSVGRIKTASFRSMVRTCGRPATCLHRLVPGAWVSAMIIARPSRSPPGGRIGRKTAISPSASSVSQPGCDGSSASARKPSITRFCSSGPNAPSLSQRTSACSSCSETETNCSCGRASRSCQPSDSGVMGWS